MEETREVFTWDVRGVEQGAEKIERSFQRVAAAEKETLRGSNGAAGSSVAMERAHARAERSIGKHLREIEREEKASLDRRVKATDDAYRRMDKAAELRHRVLVRSLKVDHEMDDAGGRRRGMGFNARYAGDALDAMTGTQGWVMRMGALQHFGLKRSLLFGGLGVAGALSARGMGEVPGFLSEGEAASSALAQRDRRGVMYANAAEGPAALNAKIEEMMQQTRERGEARNKVEEFQERKRLGKWWQSWRAVPLVTAHVYDLFRGATGQRTSDEVMQEMETDQGVTDADLKRVRAERSHAYEHEAGMAKERRSGSSFRARVMELNQAERREVAEAQRNSATPADVEQIRKKHEEERKAIANEVQVFDAQRNAAKDMAELRGGSEERALATLDREKQLAEELLTIAGEQTQEEREAAEVKLAQASQALDLAKREHDIRRATRATALTTGALGVGGAALRMGLAGERYGADQNKAFAAGQMTARFDAAAAVGTAEAALELANRKVELEERSESSLHEQAMAQQQLLSTRMRQVETEKRLTLEAQQRARMLTAELLGARNESAAMRLENSGRGDLAAVRRGRDTAEAAALEAARAGKPELAQEIMAQQDARETAAYDGKYLGADGRRRRRSAVNREYRQARRAQGRFERANARLEGNAGLIDVRRDISGNVIAGRDPLTREALTPEQIYDRKQRPINKAASEAREDVELLRSISATLLARLPDKTF